MTTESHPEQVHLSDEEVRMLEDAFTMYLHTVDDAPDGAQRFVGQIWDQYDGDTVTVEFDEAWQWEFFHNALAHFITQDYDEEMGRLFQSVLDRAQSP